MRKRIISPIQQETTTTNQDWLDMEKTLAEVEITSEDSAHPIESALLLNQTSGWRAAEPGKQTIRLIFAYPQRLRRIWLNFVETQAVRTQEYVLRWSSDGGQSFQEIVRQQWNFSPLGATSETEDHQVELMAVTVLELIIIPEISGDHMIASLAQMRLA
ncbi:MAG: carbohydrate-binding protein [Methylobacter sp.]